MGVIVPRTPTDYSDFLPLDVPPPTAAFGATGAELKRLAPMYKGYKEADVPPEVASSFHGTIWNAVVTQWFFRGLPQDIVFHAKEGIDPKKALTHIGAILQSFEPAHETKEAICAYLFSLWFEDVDPGTSDDLFAQRVNRFRKR